jgi:hypothetical protein
LLGITSKSQQVVDQLEMPEVLGQIPWGARYKKSTSRWPIKNNKHTNS